jgi:proline iminopeptidase
MIRLGSAYDPHMNPVATLRMMFAERRSKLQAKAAIAWFGQLFPGWTVMDRLGDIKAPTLVMAGRDDFVFPPEHQAQLAGGIPNAQLQIIERAGHNPHEERTAEVMAVIREFLRAPTASVPSPALS